VVIHRSPGLIIILAALCAQAPAATITRTDVSENNGKYTVSFEAVVDADSRRVRQLMTDYAHLDRLSKTIIENRVLETGTDKQRIRLVVRSCILFFCKTIKRVEDIETLKNGDIVSIAIPQLSDFHYALEHWQILAEQNQTRIKYRAELQPSFYIPPLIGPWLVKFKIRDELATSTAILENLARS
jgi:hypothetical protein